MSQMRNTNRRTEPEVLDALPLGTQRQHLHENVGLFRGVMQRERSSRRATAAVDTLDALRTQAIVSVESTAIAINSHLMRQALIQDSILKVSAMTLKVSQSAFQARSALSSSYIAQMHLNVKRTSENHQLVMDGVADGTCTQYQANAICALISRLEEDDNEAARLRMQVSKEAVDRMAEQATRGLLKAGLE